MKFRNQARLCLAIYDFEARITLMLNFSSYQTIPVTSMWLRSVNIFLVISIDL